MPYSKDAAEKFLKVVVEKLDKSAKKYSDNAYQVADIPKEVQEELVDVVGWPLLEVLRIMEVMQGKLAKVEDIYWKNFFPRQTDEFLKNLVIMALQETCNRHPEEWYDTRKKIIAMLVDIAPRR